MVISSPILHHTISCRRFFFAWNFFQPPYPHRVVTASLWSRWRKNNPQGLSLTFRYGVSSWNSLPKLQGEELRLSGDRGGPALWESWEISILSKRFNLGFMRSIRLEVNLPKRSGTQRFGGICGPWGRNFQEKMSLPELVWEAKPPESQKASCGRICLWSSHPKNTQQQRGDLESWSAGDEMEWKALKQPEPIKNWPKERRPRHDRFWGDLQRKRSARVRWVCGRVSK